MGMSYFKVRSFELVYEHFLVGLNGTPILMHIHKWTNLVIETSLLAGSGVHVPVFHKGTVDSLKHLSEATISRIRETGNNVSHQHDVDWDSSLSCK